MRTKVKKLSPELTLTHILDALAQELIDASDEEILEAAKDLGMDVRMRESAAFAGVTYTAKPQLSDFFDLELPHKKVQAVPERTARDPATTRKDRPRSTKRSQMPTERKPPSGK
jgi:hypothetical protein